MEHRKRTSRKATVPERALVICEAIHARRGDMRPFAHGYDELRVGPYTILYAPPDAYPNGRWHNVNIWDPERGKVANVEWNESHGWSVVGMCSFRSGDWEGKLLELLRRPGTLH